MEEQSVLDYVKARLNPRRKDKISLPDEPLDAQGVDENAPVIAAEAVPAAAAITWPWRMLLALVLAMGAQTLLNPGLQLAIPGAILYFVAGTTAAWSLWVQEWKVADLKEDGLEAVDGEYNSWVLVACCGFMLLSFALYGNHQFTPFNLLVIGITFALAMVALWQPTGALRSWIKKLSQGIHVSPWMMLILGVLFVSFIFRFAQLNQIPGEAFSDHAEKLLDVNDVLNGSLAVFFPRNTGREAIQFYLSAAIIRVFGTGVSFLSLKIGTALIGFLTLPFIYLLGKEIGNKWVGLFALLLTGIAYWPNVISRIGLRFPLYPLFTAPALYYLLRGLRTRKRNDFILSGIAIGLGLHGYSPFRFVPLVVLVAFGIYLLHEQSKGNRKGALIGLEIVILTSLIVFIPLLRYAVDNPDLFNYRALTRMGTLEQAFPGAPLLIFFSNLWNAWVMFFWNNGNIWVHSVPNRPALDTVTACLYFLGSVLLLVRYIRKRNWVDLFLLVSVPLLMMTSILSLAFPNENPSLNRTGGAIVPVFLIAAIALESLLRTISEKLDPSWKKQIPVFIVCAALLIPIFGENYDLVFNQFKTQFMAQSLNASQIGAVVKGFSQSVGDADSAYVIPYPYWVDTRLVGIYAGYPTKDYAIQPADLPMTTANPKIQIFILNELDTATLNQLQALYPQGTSKTYNSGRDGRDFIIFTVPAQK